MTANLAVLVEQMQVALDAIAEAVVLCNADNQVQWCNGAFEQLVNLPNSSIIGHNLTKVLPLRTAGKKVTKALVNLLNPSSIPMTYQSVTKLSSES